MTTDNVTQKAKPDAPKPTARERTEREMRENPRCTEAPKTGKGYVILGARKPD